MRLIRWDDQLGMTTFGGAILDMGFPQSTIILTVIPILTGGCPTSVAASPMEENVDAGFISAEIV